MECHPDVILKYVMGSLSPEAAGEVEAHIADCSPCRCTADDLKKLSDWAPAYQVEPGDDKNTATRRAIEEAFNSENVMPTNNALQAARVDDDKAQSHARNSFPIRWIAAAAAVALLFAGWRVLFPAPDAHQVAVNNLPDNTDTKTPNTTPSTPTGLTVLAFDSGVILERSGKRIVIDKGQHLLVGDVISTGEKQRVTLVYLDRSEIFLKANSRIAVGKNQTGEAQTKRKFLQLQKGLLEASVTPQPTPGGLTISTPHSEVNVIGTRFEVAVQEETTRVNVSKGLVEVVRATDQKAVLVQAHRSVTVKEDEPFFTEIPSVRQFGIPSHFGMIAGLAARPGEIWISHKHHTILTAMDSETGEHIHRIDVGPVCGEPDAMVWGQRYLWVIGEDKKLHALDASGKGHKVIDAPTLTDLTIADGYLWGAGKGRNVHKMNLETEKFEVAFKLATDVAGWSYGIEYYKGRLWIAAPNGMLYEVDPKSGKVLARFQTIRHCRMAYDGTDAFWIGTWLTGAIRSVKVEALKPTPQDQKGNDIQEN